MRYSRRIKALTSIGLTSLVLSILNYLAEPSTVISNIREAEPRFLVLAVICANLSLPIYALIWKHMLSLVEIQLSYAESLRLQLAGVFINNITPFGNIGGETVLTFIISRHLDVKPGKVFSALFTSGLINFAPMATLILTGAVMLDYWEIILLIPLVFLGIKAFSLINYRPELPSRIQSFTSDFQDSMSMIKGSKRKILVLLGITHTWILFDILSIALIGLAYGLNLFTLQILVIVPLARAANFVPTPGGSGPYEIALAGLLSTFTALNLGEGVLVAVTYRAITYYIGLLIGYIALNSLQIREIEKDRTT